MSIALYFLSDVCVVYNDRCMDGVNARSAVYSNVPILSFFVDGRIFSFSDHRIGFFGYKQGSQLVEKRNTKTERTILLAV